MDSSIIFILIVILAFFKLLFINDWKYRSLRDKHSKNFIRKNYKGMVEFVFFSKSSNELKLSLKIVNYAALFVIFAFVILFFISILFDINVIIKFLCNIFFAIAVIFSIYSIFRFVIMGYDTKDQKVSSGYRILMAIIIIILIALYFSKV